MSFVSPNPLLSKLIEHPDLVPVLLGSSAVGLVAVVKKFSSSLYRGILRAIKKSPEIHGAICDARIKFAENRRRLEKAMMLRE